MAVDVLCTCTWPTLATCEEFLSSGSARNAAG